jgi:hypothetical protein
MNTHANTVCAGSTFVLYETTGKMVDVLGFYDSLESIKGIQVGTCVTAVDLKDRTIIASFPQSLYFGDSMGMSLIPPAKIWNYGITVDVVPKQYSDAKSLHGIHHPDPCHLHYDRDGNELDGRMLKAVDVITPYSDPSLCTFDFSLHRNIGAASSKEHRSSVPVDVLAH